MNYLPEKNIKRGALIRRTITWSTNFILTVAGIGLFRSELIRIASLPYALDNELYLALLASTALLTAGWIVVANKEFDIMCDFLDPEDYRPPDEIVVGFTVAATLIVLLYTSRNAIWFGVSYIVYALVSIYGWWTVGQQLKIAIAKSHIRLDKYPDSDAPYIREALRLLSRYYVEQPNITRLVACLILGILGLGLAFFGHLRADPFFTAFAYLSYLISIVCLEGGVAFYWRLKLYSGIGRQEIAKHEAERKAEEA
jgi:hypothetical protein